MNTSITQKSLFKTEVLSVEYNGIRVLEKSPTKQLDYFVDFENVPASRFSITKYEKIGIMTTLVCAFFSVIMGIGMVNSQAVTVGGVIFVIAFTAIPAAVTYFSRSEFVGFGFPFGGITLRANKPSRDAVNAFLSTVQQMKTQYLRDIYLQKALPENPTEALRLLLSLKDHGALSIEEFEIRRKQIVDNGELGQLGFGTRRRQ